MAKTEERNDLQGRKVLTAVMPKKLTAETVGEILNKVIPIHKKNSKDIAYLDEYKRGNQPILYREKEVRPDIKNIVVENRAFEFVAFKLGYEFSHPLQYTNIGANKSAPVGILNTYAHLDSKATKDIELAEWMYTCGTSYRVCLINKHATVDDAPYLTDVLDPRYTFVVYSTEIGKKPILAGRYVSKTIIKDGKEEEVIVYAIYTQSYIYTWEMAEGEGNFIEKKPASEENRHLMIPIIEYPLNKSRLGYVELCIHLFNAINNIGSNRIDGIEQFIQSLLVFINCELPNALDKEGKQLLDPAGNPIKTVPKSGGAIDVKSNSPGLPADVKYLVSQLNQNDAQITKEDLLNAAYEIAGVPSRADRRSGGDTGQAVILRDGWGAAEARAKSTEKLFRKSEYEYLRIVLHLCRNIQSAAAEIGGLTLRDVGITFQRTRSDNMLVKAQTFNMLLDAGVDYELACEISELFHDPASAAEKSKKWQNENVEWLNRRYRMVRKIPGNETPADETEETIIEE